jgi:hypothetical protein
MHRLVSILAAVCWAGSDCETSAFWPGGPAGTRNPASRAPAIPSPGREADSRESLDSPRREPDDFDHEWSKSDPLFDSDNRPSWQHQHLEPNYYERPSYNRPQAEDVPIFRQEPIDKPVYAPPAYERPFDPDKPQYWIENTQAPAYQRPTMAEPALRAPNYNFPWNLEPAYDRPVYHPPEYDQPEYLPPTDTAPEYHPPRVVPEPYIAPPE